MLEDDIAPWYFCNRIKMLFKDEEPKFRYLTYLSPRKNAIVYFTFFGCMFTPSWFLDLFCRTRDSFLVAFIGGFRMLYIDCETLGYEIDARNFGFLVTIWQPYSCLLLLSSLSCLTLMSVEVFINPSLMTFVDISLFFWGSFMPVIVLLFPSLCVMIETRLGCLMDVLWFVEFSFFRVIVSFEKWKKIIRH